MTTISREAQGIIDYVEATGLPYRVTDVNGPGHATNSYHYEEGTDGEGLAVDFGGAVPGVTPVTVEQMGAIYRALADVAPHLAELIHNGPGITAAVKDGRIVNGPAVYGPATWAAHLNHVHVAVERGTFLEALSHLAGTIQQEENQMAVTVVAAFPYQNGYVLVTSTGGVYCFGCDYKGALVIHDGQVDAAYPQ